jgi:ubiquinone/menaquinone biosynthesis C-methylase UbiE
MDQQSIGMRQFGARAANYLASTVHATGADLERLENLAARLRPERALDLGSGAGHVSFAMARGGARRITAYDPAPDMLRVVAQEAAARGHAGIETCIGTAEALPFEDKTFDLVVTRFSAHHWANVAHAMAESKRVAAPGGRLVVIDVIAPEVALLDTALQSIELLRDASHVRDYRISEWTAMLGRAGFSEPTVDRWKIPIEFKSWVARIGTSPARVAALQAVFADLPSEVLQYFQVGPELSFAMDAAWFEAL